MVERGPWRECDDRKPGSLLCHSSCYFRFTPERSGLVGVCRPRVPVPAQLASIPQGARITRWAFSRLKSPWLELSPRAGFHRPQSRVTFHAKGTQRYAARWTSTACAVGEDFGDAIHNPPQKIQNDSLPKLLWRHRGPACPSVCRCFPYCREEDEASDLGVPRLLGIWRKRLRHHPRHLCYLCCFVDAGIPVL